MVRSRQQSLFLLLMMADLVAPRLWSFVSLFSKEIVAIFDRSEEVKLKYEKSFYNFLDFSSIRLIDRLIDVLFGAIGIGILSADKSKNDACYNFRSISWVKI
jgi:hypothetical protein